MCQYHILRCLSLGTMEEMVVFTYKAIQVSLSYCNLNSLKSYNISTQLILQSL